MLVTSSIEKWIREEIPRRKVFIMKSEKRPVTRLFEDLTLSQT